MKDRDKGDLKMRQTNEVTYLEVKPSDVQAFRDFLEIIEENGFTDDLIYNLMLAIANKENIAKFNAADDNSIYAKITYAE